MFTKLQSLFRPQTPEQAKRELEQARYLAQAWHGHDGDPHHDHFDIDIPESTVSSKVKTVVPQHVG